MQFSNHLILGQYIPGKSILHTLDPRCKIISMIVLLTGIFATPHVLSAFFWGGLLLLLARMGSIPLKTIWKSGKPIFFLLLFTSALHLFFTPGTPIFSLGSVQITQEGVLQAWQIGARMLLLVLFSALLMMVTTPMDFSAGMERILAPLGRIGVPTQEIAMMLTLTLRFIPTLSEEADRIAKAQLSRGADLEQKGLLRKLKAFIPILIPLFIQVFQRADNLAAAMEARCYQCRAPRTRMRPLVWHFKDTACLTFVLFCVVAAYFFLRSEH